MVVKAQVVRALRKSSISLIVAALLITTTSCTSDGTTDPSAGTSTSATGPRPLTQQEAERMAILRFNNYDAGTKAISGTITNGTTQVSLTGWINYVDHVGYALADPGTTQTSSPFLVEWTFGEVGTQNYSGTTPPLPVPIDGWEVQEFDPSVSFLANAQAILLNLAADRPDNPQLLTQSSARWLRSDTVHGIAVDVFAGPKEADGEAPDPTDTSESRLRYWVDATGNLLRIEMRIGTDLWSLVDFTDAPEVVIPNPNATGDPSGAEETPGTGTPQPTETATG